MRALKERLTTLIVKAQKLIEERKRRELLSSNPSYCVFVNDLETTLTQIEKTEKEEYNSSSAIERRNKLKNALSDTTNKTEDSSLLSSSPITKSTDDNNSSSSPKPSTSKDKKEKKEKKETNKEKETNETKEKETKEKESKEKGETKTKKAPKKKKKAEKEKEKKTDKTNSEIFDTFDPSGMLLGVKRSETETPKHSTLQKNPNATVLTYKDLFFLIKQDPLTSKEENIQLFYSLKKLKK